MVLEETHFDCEPITFFSTYLFIYLGLPLLNDYLVIWQDVYKQLITLLDLLEIMLFIGMHLGRKYYKYTEEWNCDFV